MVHYYTYKLHNELLFQNSLYRKNSPKQACASIFRKILRGISSETYEVDIIVKDLDNNRLFYYNCKAIYDPKQIRVSQYKLLNQRYDILILKLHAKCFT